MEKRASISRAFSSSGIAVTSLSACSRHTGALQRKVDRADHDAVLAQRDLPQQEWGAAGGLQQLERVAHAGFRFLDLVEEENARDGQLLQPAQDELERGDFLLVGLGNDDGRIAGGQNRLRLGRKFDRAGAIGEGDLLAHEIGRREGRLHAHGMGAGLRRRIADRIA
jgi:hypothetical protein